VPDYLRTYLLEQIAAWALARAAAAEDAAARLAADRAVLIAQRDAIARKLAEAERRARRAEALAGVGRIWRALALGFPAGCADPAPAALPAGVEPPAPPSGDDLPTGLRWHTDHHGGWEVRDAGDVEVGCVVRERADRWVTWTRCGPRSGEATTEAEARAALARSLRDPAPAALPPSVLPIQIEEPTLRLVAEVTLPGFVDSVELSVRVLP